MPQGTAIESQGSNAAHADEVASGRRFEFGKNWSRFLTVLNDERIDLSVRSLQGMLGVEDLKGKSFLDIGSGSGLFSLAARRLGAAVRSFDYDPSSVACTAELRRRYFPDDPHWTVEHGSALDELYLARLGTFDVCYSWGVLHHTGNLWQALANVVPLVAPKGSLFISIYNDQGIRSRGWREVKRMYCSGAAGRLAVSSLFLPYFALTQMGSDATRGRKPWQSFAESKARGMSMVHDWFDWLGGYPFEVATPDAVFDFYRSRGFVLNRLRTVGGTLSCNEFVFRRES